MRVSIEEIEKRLKKLHPKLKSALESDEVAEKIEKIGKDFGIKDLDRFVEICGYVFLNFLSLNKLQTELEKEFQLKSQKAKVLVNTLTKEIFEEYLPLIEKKTEKKESSLEELEKEIDMKLSSLEKEIDKKLKGEESEKRNEIEDKYREKIEIKDNFGVELRERGKLKKIF